MLNSFYICVPVGTTLGFLAGLGIGGGSLLMLWLTAVVGMAYPDARFINLLFFLPSATVACFFRWKQGCVPWKKIFPGILSGCIAAALFSWLGAGLDNALLKKAFGILLIVTGIRELFYKPQRLRKPK